MRLRVFESIIPIELQITFFLILIEVFNLDIFEILIYIAFI